MERQAAALSIAVLLLRGWPPAPGMGRPLGVWPPLGVGPAVLCCLAAAASTLHCGPATPRGSRGRHRWLGGQRCCRLSSYGEGRLDWGAHLHQAQGNEPNRGGPAAARSVGQLLSAAQLNKHSTAQANKGCTRQLTRTTWEPTELNRQRVDRSVLARHLSNNSPWQT